MHLEEIPESGSSTHPILNTAECVEILNVYKEYYPKIGFEKPWIGYFIIDNGVAVGTCSFTGKPNDNLVEVAYYTFPAYEGKGYASWACGKLVRIALEHNLEVTITAKTAPEENASTRILKKNGFRKKGVVQDHEIGDAWEWLYVINNVIDSFND